ncbi:MAG: hypothetical protein QGH73_13835, partial [Rhodospirillales bacterium]|nr:hypothetical protein [Rhodospirillales bacterium]
QREPEDPRLRVKMADLQIKTTTISVKSSPLYRCDFSGRQTIYASRHEFQSVFYPCFYPCYNTGFTQTPASTKKRWCTII